MGLRFDVLDSSDGTIGSAFASLASPRGRPRASRASITCIVALALAGCSDTARLLDAGSDARERDGGSTIDAQEQPDDGMGLDRVAPSETSPNDASDAGPTRCRSSAECAATAATPVCDTASGQCVACTPADDRCPAGQYCASNNRCGPGCRDDASCRGAGRADAGADTGAGDGGGAMRCDTARHVCVGCLRNEDCGPGFLCNSAGVCMPGCNAMSACPAGQTCCNNQCLQTQSDVSNCGMCGNACALTNAVPTCTTGRCTVMSCRDGFGDCDANAANGCETDVLRTVAHCGRCMNACPTPANATATCDAGRCGMRCNDGFADCDGNAANGCETDTRSDARNCGRCANACPGGANATPACGAGTCRLNCGVGYGDCDGNPTNGCETDTRTDARNCGTCANACPSRTNASPSCAGGSCAIECAAGFADCDGVATTGCEADLRGTSNCGRCGQVCSLAAPLCAVSGSSFACSSGCTAGQTRCGSSCTSTLSDPQNCGDCGTACPARANATRTCAMGTCGIACNDGFGDCDGSAATGCEAVLATDARHCGRCGNACAALANANVECRAGTCAIGSCVAGFADCDGNAANGCETNLNSDPMNCGRCRTVCSRVNITSPMCTAGVCGGTCNAGFGDCDRDPVTGCEADLSSDPRHCGACNAGCSSGACGTYLLASMSEMPRSWSFNRDAAYDATARSAVLTTATPNQTGTLFYLNSIPLDRFSASFEFRMGGGTRADGMAFVFQRTSATAVGATGGGFGAVGLNGFMVELDEFNNNTCTDTNGSHVGVDTLEVCDPAVNTPVAIATGPDFTGDLANNAWRRCTVTFDNGRVSVSVDGAMQVSNAMVPGFTAGTRYWVGFAGATGAQTNRHEVRNVRIDFPTARCL